VQVEPSGRISWQEAKSRQMYVLALSLDTVREDGRAQQCNTIVEMIESHPNSLVILAGTSSLKAQDLLRLDGEIHVGIVINSPVF
jgi:hypothetical protein